MSLLEYADRHPAVAGLAIIAVTVLVILTFFEIKLGDKP